MGKYMVGEKEHGLIVVTNLPVRNGMLSAGNGVFSVDASLWGVLTKDLSNTDDQVCLVERNQAPLTPCINHC